MEEINLIIDKYIDKIIDDTMYSYDFKEVIQILEDIKFELNNLKK